MITGNGSNVVVSRQAALRLSGWEADVGGTAYWEARLFAKPCKFRNRVSFDCFHRPIEPGKFIDCPFGRSLKIGIVPIPIIKGDVTV
jgi:hypothetical protein